MYCLYVFLVQYYCNMITFSLADLDNFLQRENISYYGIIVFILSEQNIVIIFYLFEPNTLDQQQCW